MFSGKPGTIHPARRTLRQALPALFLSLAMTAAPAPEHHAPQGGFRMPGLPSAPLGFGAFLRWRWQAFRQGVPRPAANPTPRVPPDLAWIHENAKAGPSMVEAVTWIGHSSVLVQTGGRNLLLDPVFSDRVSPLRFAGPRRALPPGLLPEELPPIDAVLISHNHYDHLDLPSLRLLAAQAGGSPRIIVPLGLGAWFRRKGIARVEELDWWQETQVGSVTVVLTPTRHWSSRGLFDRNKTLWGGFALRTARHQVFYPGDTGYGPEFKAIGERLRQAGPLDLALLPIGAYAPRWFMARQHIDPTEAVQILQDLGALEALAVHWGTFQLTDEPLDEPPLRLAEALDHVGIPRERFRTLPIGGTLRVTRPAGAPEKPVPLEVPVAP